MTPDSLFDWTSSFALRPKSNITKPWSKLFLRDLLSPHKDSKIDTVDRLHRNHNRILKIVAFHNCREDQHYWAIRLVCGEITRKRGKCSKRIAKCGKFQQIKRTLSDCRQSRCRISAWQEAPLWDMPTSVGLITWSILRVAEPLTLYPRCQSASMLRIFPLLHIIQWKLRIHSSVWIWADWQVHVGFRQTITWVSGDSLAIYSPVLNSFHERNQALKCCGHRNGDDSLIKPSGKQQ